jgi:hypothetical protein
MSAPGYVEQSSTVVLPPPPPLDPPPARAEAVDVPMETVDVPLTSVDIRTRMAVRELTLNCHHPVPVAELVCVVELALFCTLVIGPHVTLSLPRPSNCSVLPLALLVTVMVAEPVPGSTP